MDEEESDLQEVIMSCKNCDKRTFDCHTTCEDYKAFKEKAKKEKAARTKYVEQEKAFNSLTARRGKRRRGK